MSAPVEQMCLAPLPQTTRGFGRTIYAASRKDGDWMIYTFGRHVIMRNLKDPKISKIFSEHKANTNVAAFSPNGHWVASGDANGKVLVWGTSNMIVKNEVEVCSSVNDITWGPESKKLCAVGAGSSNLAKVFAFDSGNNIGEVAKHSKSIISASYKPTRPYRIATGGEDLSVNFYQGPPFKFDHSHQKHERYPNRVQYAPNGEVFVSVGADSKIVVYGGKEGEFLREIEDKENGHKSAIYSCCWSPDSTQLLTCGADKTAKIWDVESGTVKVTLTVNAKPQVEDMQMAALWFKDYIITQSLSGALNYWDPATPDAPVQVIHGHMAPVTCVAAGNEGQFFSGDSAGRLTVWNDGVGTWFSGKGHGKAISAAAVSADGDQVLTAGYDDKVRISECKTNTWDEDGVVVGGRPTDVTTSAKDNDLAVAVVAQGKVVVLRKGVVVTTLDVSYKPNAVALSPDDSEVMVGGNNKTVYFYTLDGDTLKEKRQVKEHNKAVTSVRYSPDGATMSSASADFAVLCCDDQGEYKNPSRWEFHSSAVQDHQWNKSGTNVVTVANDLSIFVFQDTEKFKTKKLCQQNAQMDGINCVSWLDEEVFVSGAVDGSLKVWTTKQSE
jgi:WD40 repeat protein